MSIRNLEGMRFERWLVIERGPDYCGGKDRWYCICECGKRRLVGGCNLVRGLSKSCGCKTGDLGRIHLRAISTKHGCASAAFKTPEYRSWSAMLSRCKRQVGRHAQYYFAKGVRVCDRWRKFENFLADMGPMPIGAVRFTIDRFPNPNGNYEPGNCRWATYKQQSESRLPYGAYSACGRHALDIVGPADG